MEGAFLDDLLTNVSKKKKATRSVSVESIAVAVPQRNLTT